MIVRFSGSESNIKEKYSTYKRILGVISEKDVVSYNWIDEALMYAFKKDEDGFIDDRDWNVIQKKTIEDIHKADVCIFESSKSSFAVGFQVAYSLQLQKPCLVLKDVGGIKSNFGSGIVSNLLKYVTYENEDDIMTAVRDFLDMNRLEQNDLRFNFVIDREIYNYLKWASFKSNSTKADIVRKIIRENIYKER
jgi:hypothetical protein